VVDLAPLTSAIEAGDRAAARSLTQAAIDDGLDPEAILLAMTGAMRAVGDRFQRNEIYIPEMLISARAMKEATALLEPLLVRAGIRPEFTAVIGTVKGDLHDIGKNLVMMMWKGAAIEVIDLGTDVSAERFVDAAREHGARIVGISALLTTTMVGMKDVVAAIRAASLGDVRVIVGGAPVSQKWSDLIKADGYAKNGVQAVELVRDLLRPTISMETSPPET